MSRQTPTRRTVSRTRSVSYERLSEYNFKCSGSSLGGTRIYESVCPHGSPVFVDFGSNKWPADADVSDEARELQDIAEKCAAHLTGYVVVHPDCTLIKHVDGTQHTMKSTGQTSRVVPLLTIEEIEADPIHSALNADKVSAAVLSDMLLRTHDIISEYDSVHVGATSAARKYFTEHTRRLDDSVIEARASRDNLMSGKNDAAHCAGVTKSVHTLEQLHAHALSIRESIRHLKAIQNQFELMHGEFEL